MSVDNPSMGGDLRSPFFEIVEEARDIASTMSTESLDRLGELERMVGEMFVGKYVRIYPTDASTGTPITAYYERYQSAHDYVGGVSIVQKRPQALFMETYPPSARGKIAIMDLFRAEMVVKPRMVSPYRGHNGYFGIKLLNSSGKPNVEVEF